MSEVAVPFVRYIVLLDSDGERIVAKHFDDRSKEERTKNEMTLYKKSKQIGAKSEAEVLLLEEDVVVFRGASDVKFFVCGPLDENELILVSVLDCIYDTVDGLLRGQVDKKTIFDNLELILLTIDEIIDHGHIIEVDWNSVISRVLMKCPSEGGSSGNSRNAETPIGDLTISQALGLAKDSFFKSLATGGR